MAVAIAGCGSSGSVHDSYRVELPLNQVRQGVVELASCPSPLKRLQIAAPLRQVTEPDRETVVINVPAPDSGEAMVLRFSFGDAGTADHPATSVRASIDVPESASELDLGEDRLLNPLKLGPSLSSALKGYLEQLGPGPAERDAAAAKAEGRPLPFGNRTPQERTARRAKAAEQCSSIGRQLDAGAVMISPALTKEVRRQHRRDAINWLFQDDYKLRTESDADAYWDDSSGDPYGYGT